MSRLSTVGSATSPNGALRKRYAMTQVVNNTYTHSPSSRVAFTVVALVLLSLDGLVNTLRLLVQEASTLRADAEPRAYVNWA